MKCWHATSALLLLWLLFAGCESVKPVAEIEWERFQDEQQNWPTSETGLMHLVDGFPVYALEQLPAASYDVLGWIRLSTPSGIRTPDEHKVVQYARQRAGEAALQIQNRTPGAGLDLRQNEYLVVKFKTNFVAVVLDRINICLALSAANTNGYTGPDFRGGTVHYTAEELINYRAELEHAKQAILASPEFQRNARSTPTNEVRSPVQ